MVAWAIAQSEQEHEELLTQYEDRLLQDLLILRAYLGEGYLGGLFRRRLFRRACSGEGYLGGLVWEKVI